MSELGIDLADRKPKLLSTEDAEWADVVLVVRPSVGVDALPGPLLGAGSTTVPASSGRVPPLPDAPGPALARAAPLKWFPP